MELTLDEALTKGVEAHQAGQVQEANKLYTAILKAQPKHPDANHNMGVLAVGIGKVQEALPFLKIALDANPSIGQFWLSYINALIKVEQMVDARAVLYQAKGNGAKGEAFDKLEQQLSEQGLKVNDTDGMVAGGSDSSKHNILDITKLDKALRLAKQKSKDGQTEEAKNIYEDILQKFPKHKQSLTALQSLTGGVTRALQDPPPKQLQPIINLYTQGQVQQALFECAQMLKRFPTSVTLYNIAGASNAGLMKFDAAVESFKQVLKINPDNVGAYNNIGIALRGKGDLEAAIDSFKQALKINSHHVEAYNNMGNALKDQGDLEAAINSYKMAIKFKPNNAEAYNNMGIALNNKGEPKTSINCYKKAIKIKPDYGEAYGNLAITLIGIGNRDGALANLKKSHELIRGPNPINPFHKSFLTISKAKIDHDIEQFRYLADSGYEVMKFKALADIYRRVSLDIDWQVGEIQQLSNEHQQLLRETYNRPLNVLEAPELANGVINATLDREHITENYFKHDHGMTYIDNFLTPSALNSIREFLLGSTIWFNIKKGGYLGAYLNDGLACPLLLQIAEDLRTNFPGIFKNHQLLQLWAYKYDSRAYKDDNGLTGIKAHADAAAVNVNFWITTAAANLNPESGGLIVYSTLAPLEWSFKTFNSNQEEIAKHLQSDSCEKSIVPYNENRAVIFNSNLIHETDKFEFKEGYENRRINVTMLFGLRGD